VYKYHGKTLLGPDANEEKVRALLKNDCKLDQKNAPPVISKDRAWDGGKLVGDRPSPWEFKDVTPELLQPGKGFLVVLSPYPGGN
jgi:hypothetical protein